MTTPAPVCAVFTDRLNRKGACGHPGIGTVLGICVHEHLAEWPICLCCAAEAQQTALDGGIFVCALCGNHDCPMRVEISFAVSGDKILLQAGGASGR